MMEEYCVIVALKRLEIDDEGSSCRRRYHR